MKREDEFKKWLEQGGAETEPGRASRTYAIRTIEKKLQQLGSPFADLSEAWHHDKFVALRERLKRMREDARSGGQDYRMLMPDSENPGNRLSNWGSWLGQFGRFLAGEAPGAAKDADRIRRYALERYIEPAREEGRGQVDILVRDVNAALGLKEAWPNICQALIGRKFLELADVAPPERIGAEQSSATVFRFDMRKGGIDRQALEKLREKFLEICPDFRTFADPGTGWVAGERAFKDEAMESIRAARAEASGDAALGAAAFKIMHTAASTAPLVRWQTEDTIAKRNPELLGEFHSVLARLLKTEDATAPALSVAYQALCDLRERGASILTYGERVSIIFSVLAMVRPGEMAPLKLKRINRVWEHLIGEKLFVETQADIATNYRRFADVFEDIFEIMRDEWNWHPRDWIDVQGFLWIARYDVAAPQETSEASTDSRIHAEGHLQMRPVNLILYGPPGTGKTYATAAEAVRLCGEPVPDDRSELMIVYQHLLAAGRIEFVTFHQSMAYEDFIEGRQPKTGSTESEDTGSIGFRLETVPGIFWRIAKRAETSRGRSPVGDAIGLERPDAGGRRKVFKMSIGEANNPEDAHLFEEAVEGGYTLIGFEDIDWSDAKYESRDAIIEACKALGERNAGVGPHSGVVQMPHIFRNWVSKGDIVIVSKGNGLFRAIGEFTGDYEFHPRPEGDYAHRRPVRWLWVDKAGVPVSEIYSRGFSQKSIYLLYDSELNAPALERYMNSQKGDGPANPEPFVLIVDEINRANISKVFGELITLLEPDKRLGQPNALKVRLPYSGEEFGVPSNLHVVGTMNTADRSIALLDTALRRRFTFREMMPDPSILEDAAHRCGIDLPRLLATLNERIEYLYDREHQIGHAYFTSCASRDDVDEVMRNKVIPLLAEYFYEDWSKIAAVLGDHESHDGPIEGGFLKRTVLKAPPGFGDQESQARFRWAVRGEAFDYAKLTGS